MRKILVVISLALALFLFVCGCTSPSPPPAPVTTAIPTPVPTGFLPPVVTTSAASLPAIYPLQPGPVQTLPDYESVSVTVDRNTITENPTISVVYNGGKGLGMTEKMSVYVIRSDGSQVSGFIPNPRMGSTVTLMGDTGTDQVIVYLTMTSGDTYKVIDKNYPFTAQL